VITSHQSSFDVVVVGGGPAGIAAASTAAECGQRVALVDDNALPGGQIWRRGAAAHPSATAQRWLDRLAKSPVKIFAAARVIGLAPNTLEVESRENFSWLHYRSLVLATGARELFLPFPGWTLGNVFGAGGLQALVKSGLAINGKRVIVAGTGPLLMAVAAYLTECGAQVLCICEQASRGRLARFALAMVTVPGKLGEALRFRRQMGRIPYWPNSWVTEAIGREHLETVRISHGRRTLEIPCDYLACGFHLLPNLELARLTGCRIRQGFVVVDEFQETSTPNIFCCGEPTGIGGLELSLLEGQVAGAAAADRKDAARAFFAARAKFCRAVGPMRTAFALRDELKTLARSDTIFCRCEDVSFDRVRNYGSWRAAKLHTRCGMGPCQGRICGAAAEFEFGWDLWFSRPPVFSARLESLSASSGDPDAASPLHGG
jgi:D-hydroxyproline dehydrogenase subunit alpha